MLRAHNPGLPHSLEAPTPEFGIVSALSCWPLALVISGVCELWFESHRIGAYRGDCAESDN